MKKSAKDLEVGDLIYINAKRFSGGYSTLLSGFYVVKEVWPEYQEVYTTEFNDTHRNPPWSYRLIFNILNTPGVMRIL